MRSRQGGGLLQLLLTIAIVAIAANAPHAARASSAAPTATTSTTSTTSKNDAYHAQPARAQLERAVKLARQLVRTHPDVPEGHLQLAVALHQLGDLAPDGGTRNAEAEAAYRAALSLLVSAAADEAAIHVRGNLAVLLLSAGRISDALNELDAALSDAAALGFAPDETAPTHFNRGKALSAAGGRAREADAAYAEAMRGAAGGDLATFGKAAAALTALPPDVARAVARVAAAGREALRGRAGLEFLAEIEAEWPSDENGDSDDDSAANGENSSSGNNNNIDPATAAEVAAAALAAADPASKWLSSAQPSDLAWLHFAAYRADDRAGRAERAWAHLRAGNALMAANRGGRYDARREREALEALTDAFKGPFDAPPPPPPLPGSNALGRGAVFIVGAPRSGSTLIEQMFAAHPRAFGAGEDTRLAPIVADLQIALAKPGADEARELRRAGERYLEQMRALVPAAAAGDVTHIVDKMLMNIWRVGHILLMLPGACVLHAARHPLDAAASIYAQPFAYDALPWAWDLGGIAEHLELVWALADHWSEVAPARFHTVYYEALVAAPRATIARALAACGLPFDARVLDFHAARRAHGVHTASQAQVTRPLYGGSVGRWRRHACGLAPTAARLAPLVARYEERLAAAMAATAAQGDGEAPAVVKDEL